MTNEVPICYVMATLRFKKRRDKISVFFVIIASFSMESVSK